MKISAQVENGNGNHRVTLKTNDQQHSITIAPKSSGLGSSINGGELLFLALATCYCNDIYREAAKRKINVTNIDIIVLGDFGSEGEPAKNVTYNAKVKADATESEIQDLLRHTDRVAEIQNTLRAGIPVTLNQIEVISV